MVENRAPVFPSAVLIKVEYFLFWLKKDHPCIGVRDYDAFLCALLGQF